MFTLEKMPPSSAVTALGGCSHGRQVPWFLREGGRTINANSSTKRYKEMGAVNKFRKGKVW